MKRTLLLYVVIAFAVSFATAVPPAVAGVWTGKEVTKEGVVHELNPATPSDGNATLTPREAWRAGGDDEDDALFGVLSSVAVDDQDNVYVLDMQLSQVNVFDKSGKLVRTIGHEGEGPGEFRRANIMFLMPDGNVAVLQQMPGKIVVITPDGKPGADFHGPGGKDGGMIAYMDGGRAGSSIVLSTRSFVQSSAGFSTEKSLMLVGADGQTRATLFAARAQQDMGSMMNLDEKEMRGVVWAGAKDGRVYVSDNFDAYTINVYSPEGKLERVIEREYTHRPRTKEEMEESKPHVTMRAGNGQRLQPTIKSSATDRDVLRILPRDDGSLWVLSSRGGNGQPQGTLASYDVFDGKGHFVRTVTFKLPINARQDEFHIARDHVVVVKSARSARDAFMAEGDETKADEDVEPVSLVAYRFDAPATAKN